MKGAKTRLAYLGIFVSLSLAVFSTAHAANISFTADAELSLTGLAATLYALSGSAADTVTVNGSTLTVEIPSGSSFTLGAGSSIHTTLKVTPTAGSSTLTFEAANLTSGGYATQWTLDSTTSTSWALSVGVSQSNTNYNIKVNSIHHGIFQADSSGIVAFSYGGNLSGKTFSIDQRDSAGSTGQLTPEAREQFLQEQQDIRDIEALKARIRELQLVVIDLAKQLVEALQQKLVQQSL